MNTPSLRFAPIATPKSVRRLSPVAAGCLLLLIGGAEVAVAQQAQTITVTGIRRGIENAIATKKNADGIVEAVSSEDIGKLPDTTVAESLSRLPGVTIQRSGVTGRAKDVSVRGMAPAFNGGLLNGREVASTSDGRNVDYDQYPAELMSQLVVHKTPSASLLGQGLASTIDQQTIRPLSFPKRTVVIGYKHEYTAKADNQPGFTTGSGDRFNISYVDQFLDRTLGVALGFARYDAKGGVRPSAEWGGSVDYDVANNKFAGWDGAGCKVAGAQCAKAPAGFKFLPEQQDSKRDGAMATLQWKPHKDFELVGDVFYSKGDFSRKRRGIEGPVGALSTGGNDAGGSLLPGYTVANGVITSGTISNFRGVVDAHNNDVHDELNAFGLNGKWKTGGWTLIGDVSTSKVTKREPRTETTIGLPATSNNASDTISWSGFNGNNAIDGTTYKTGINYADAGLVRLTNPQGWGGSTGQDGYFAEPVTKDQVDGLRITGKRAVSFGPVSEFEAGVHFGQRSKDRKTREGALLLPGSTSPAVGANATIPGAGAGIAYGIPVATWDPAGSVGSVYQLSAWADSGILNKSWNVKEKTTTAYVQGNLDGEAFGLNWRGNVGVQFTSTQQTSGGYNIQSCDGATHTCVSTYNERGRSYNEVLPALNLATDLGGDQVVRFALGRQLARPKMEDLKNTIEATIDTTKGTISASGGNPNLKPFLADAVDLSYEKYFGTRGVVSLSLFHKQLKSYIVRGTTTGNIAQYLLPGQLPANFPTVNGNFSQPVNGEGGSLSGAEFQARLPFSMLTRALDGFGMDVNFAYTDSSVNLPTSGVASANIGGSTIPLPGLSKTTGGLRLYYEAGGFQVSVAGRHRSKYIGSIQDFQDNVQLVWVKPEKAVDAQVSYEFQGGPLKGLSLMLQGYNLTNAPQVRYNEVTGDITESKKYGAQYLVGATYKF